MSVETNITNMNNKIPHSTIENPIKESGMPTKGEVKLVENSSDDFHFNEYLAKNEQLDFKRFRQYSQNRLGIGSNIDSAFVIPKENMNHFFYKLASVRQLQTVRKKITNNAELTLAAEKENKQAHPKNQSMIDNMNILNISGMLDTSNIMEENQINNSHTPNIKNENKNKNKQYRDTKLLDAKFNIYEILNDQNIMLTDANIIYDEEMKLGEKVNPSAISQANAEPMNECKENHEELKRNESKKINQISTIPDMKNCIENYQTSTPKKMIPEKFSQTEPSSIGQNNIEAIIKNLPNYSNVPFNPKALITAKSKKVQSSLTKSYQKPYCINSNANKATPGFGLSLKGNTTSKTNLTAEKNIKEISKFSSPRENLEPTSFNHTSASYLNTPKNKNSRNTKGKTFQLNQFNKSHGSKKDILNTSTGSIGRRSFTGTTNKSLKGGTNRKTKGMIEFESDLNAIEEYDYSKILLDLKAIFGENLEYFDENMLFSNLDEMSNKGLIKGLLMLSHIQDKKLKAVDQMILKLKNQHKLEQKQKENQIKSLNDELAKLKSNLRGLISEPVIKSAATTNRLTMDSHFSKKKMGKPKSMKMK